jgi:hypothetical protein
MKTSFLQNPLFLKFKIFIISMCVVFSLLSFTAINSTTSFGKRFNPNKDFTCCIKGQLYKHHFYNYYIFGIKTATGFIDEAVGKPNPESCNIECAE